MSTSDAYGWLEEKWARGEAVVLDGGVGSELERVGFPQDRNLGRLWGTRALYEAPDLTKEVHRRYAAAGADLIKTNTWQIGNMPAAEKEGFVDASGGGWQMRARLAVDLAREAVTESRRGPCAIAYSLSSHCLDAEFLERLLESLAEKPPDLFLVETLTEVPSDLEFPAFERILSTGIPVWVAYRRCVDGACDVHGDVLRRDAPAFEGAIPKLEAIGVSAILINCLPMQSVAGMLPRLRELTDLPLGVYPNVGRYLDPGWSFDLTVTPLEYADEALRWQRQEGAQIVGGCCGVTPDHIHAVADASGRVQAH